MIGIHVAKQSKVIPNKKYKTMQQAIREETEIFGLSACSIFTHGPRNRNRNAMDYAAVRTYCEDEKVALYPHGSYVSVALWGVNEKNKLTTKSVEIMEHIYDMLISCRELGSRGLVIHLPKKAPTIVVESLRILGNYLTKKGGALPELLLEMPASRPDANTYETPTKLNNLCHLIREGDVDLKWGLCVDTAHLYVCGIDLSTDNSWSAWCGRLDAFTQNKIHLIHLNGALLSNFGTGKDVHIIPMSKEDALWGGYMSTEMRDFLDRKNAPTNLYEQMSAGELTAIKESSLYDIITWAVGRQVGLICEINRGSFIDAKFAIDTIVGLSKKNK